MLKPLRDVRPRAPECSPSPQTELALVVSPKTWADFAALIDQKRALGTSETARLDAFGRVFLIAVAEALAAPTDRVRATVERGPHHRAREVRIEFLLSPGGETFVTAKAVVEMEADAFVVTLGDWHSRERPRLKLTLDGESVEPLITCLVVKAFADAEKMQPEFFVESPPKTAPAL